MNSAEFRSSLEQLLDQVLETGEPLEIEHRGKKLYLTVEAPPQHRRPVRRDALTGDPEGADEEGDWLEEWSG